MLKGTTSRPLRGRISTLCATVSIAALAAAAAAPAHALVPNDDLGPDGAVDVNNDWAGVGQMFNRRLNPDGTVSTFLCTGQLINPRVVVFAQHCTAGVTDEGYGPGQGNHMAFGFDPLDTLTGYFDWRNTGLGTGVWQSNPDNLFYNVLQVESVFNTAESFPGGDVVMASFDTPVIGLPTYGMLFSPLDGPTHAALVGYGTTGTGSTGDNLGIDFKRRAGENMIDGLFSQADFLAATFVVPGLDFGVEGSQLLYHIDFDKPNRVPDDCARGEFFGLGFGNDLVCFTPPFGGAWTWDLTSAIQVGENIDWYPGDALPGESGTAGGDSGSALFADDIYERPLITGVLSGGWVNGFASPLGGYGDVSYYNPLFLFKDWLVENNPYVYANARNGSRNWSDPHHWVQAMDPNYFYIDEHGRVRNGLPAGAEPGYYADAPKWGTVFDQVIPDDIEGATAPEAALLAASEFAPSPDIGVLDDPLNGGGGSQGQPPINPPVGPPAAGPTGPGAGYFVPNNDYGTYGSWTGAADGIARFYDVTLNNVGTTTLDMDVEIDNLTISGALSALDVQSGHQLNSLVAVDQFKGAVNVDGGVDTREYMLWGGVLTGDGAISAQTLYNVSGVLSPGELLGVGDLTVDGDYVQTSDGVLVINVAREKGQLSNDLLDVNGAASLAGLATVLPTTGAKTLKFNDRFTVVDAESVIGDFDDVDLLLTSFLLYGRSEVDAAAGDVDIVVDAHQIQSVLDPSHWAYSMGGALDAARWGGSYALIGDVFSVIDGATAEQFGGALMSVSPYSAFQQSDALVTFSNSFTSHLADRSAELRAGSTGVSAAGLRGGMTASGAALTADPSAAPTPSLGGRFGIFVAMNGTLETPEYRAPGQSDHEPVPGLTHSVGDLAVGADYRLTDHLAAGIAVTTSRYELTTDGVTPMDADSVGAAAYATAYGDGWFLDGYYGYAKQDFEMERLVGLAGDSAISYGAPIGRQSLAGVRAGWGFEPARGLTLSPVVGLNYWQAELGDYREAVGGDFNLAVEARELTSLSVETGAELRYAHVTDRGRVLTAHGRLSMLQELADGTDVIGAYFVDAPEYAFDVTRTLDRDWVGASAGVSYLVSRNLSLQLQVSGDIDRGPLSSNFTTVGIDWRF